MTEATANSNHGGLMSVTSTPPCTVIDINSPYYLPTANHPGLNFVIHPLSENGENYFTWRRNFLNALRSKNKAGFVDGTIGKAYVNSQNFQPWVQCNAIVLSWLTKALAKEIQSSAAHADTASEVRLDLQERFTQGVAPQVYELKSAIALLQQEKTTISSYYGKLKSVWNELEVSNPIPVCTCGCICGAAKNMESMREEEKVYAFLISLDDIFNTVRSQILSIDPLPTLGRAYAIAAQEEKQQLVAATRTPPLEATTLLAQHVGDIQSMAFAATTGRRREKRIRGSGEKIWCTQCGKPNHSKEQCYELVGYPANWSASRHRSVEVGTSAYMSDNFSGKTATEIPWDLPSGTLIGVGKARTCLYFSESTGGGTTLIANMKKDTNLWHHRLGHLPIDCLPLISNISGKFDFKSQLICDACCKAKQTQLSIPTWTTKTTRAFELIHSDIGDHIIVDLTQEHTICSLS
ncbi:hypothetical protein RJ640_021824 [Escallonia rubra]|uniref:Retrotransposon Copia-like N-terminal domain-containing protein n=1 Tax=Escallonia rubra TaxID=112253 RepID=A0AA88RNZ2_9ASTE|nr:hypothetical protein RJ640_021824 [Escallonia rubra]